MDLYALVVFVHVLALFVFLAAHGTSMVAVYRLRTERDMGRIQAYLAFSRSGLEIAYVAFIVLVIAGIVAGIMRAWFTNGQLWIWASLGLLVVMFVLMHYLGTRRMDDVRRSVGIEPLVKRKGEVAGSPADAAVVTAAQDRLQPVPLLLVGYGGLAIITWLMMFKPF